MEIPSANGGKASLSGLANAPVTDAMPGNGARRTDSVSSARVDICTPRRVIYLDHTASLGGGEIALFNLVVHLDRSRYEPVVVLFSDGPLRARLLENSIETHLIPLSSTVIGARKDSLGFGSVTKIKGVFESLRFVLRLAKFLRTLNGSLTHTNSLKSDILGGLAAKWAGLPVLWHVRDRIDSDYLPPRVVAVFRRLCRIIPDIVIANSAATLETIKLGDGDVGATAPLGGEVSFRTRVVHDGTIEPDARLLNHDVPGQRPGVILVGRISRWKGQHVFIRAAAIVHDRFPSARFQIVGSAMFGEDDYEREIRELLHELQLDDCVELTGFRSDVADIIRHSTLLVHASIVGEPFGQVLIEAMAAEKPVVATKGGGVPEIVNDGITGLLVAMGDVEGMAAAICKVLDDPDLARTMGKHGRQRVSEHFTIQHTVAKVQNIYDDVVEAPGTTRSGLSRLWSCIRSPNPTLRR
jgi:glycosyltransferase involved in cell wall biosynthesis